MFLQSIKRNQCNQYAINNKREFNTSEYPYRIFWIFLNDIVSLPFYLNYELEKKAEIKPTRKNISNYINNWRILKKLMQAGNE